MANRTSPAEDQAPSAIEVAVARCLDPNGDNIPEYIGHARDVIEALGAAGYVIVPREPTEGMRQAGAHPRENRKPVADIWRAMVEAAP
jgi:hypothetical protein